MFPSSSSPPATITNHPSLHPHPISADWKLGVIIILYKNQTEEMKPGFKPIPYWAEIKNLINFCRWMMLKFLFF